MSHTPSNPHEDHMAWQQEHEQWNRLLAEWRPKVPELIQQLGSWLETELSAQEAAIRAHAQAIDDHEVELTKSEQEGAPQGGPVGSHPSGSGSHEAARQRQARLADTVAGLEALVRAVS